MISSNEVCNILLENCTTLKERNYVLSTVKESDNINNVMITNLYKSAIDKEHINFEDIPESKGDITKYSGYKSMMDSISLLKEISKKSNITIKELEIVEQTITNITIYKDSFMKGFQMDKEFIILQYNTLVYACVEAVSAIISSYVDFIKRVDKIEFTIIKSTTLGGWLCIQNLQKFNDCVKRGDFTKVMSAIISSGKEGFVGTAVVITGMVLGGLILLVPIIRELIFYFYYSRMSVSEYLKCQSAFLEINKNNIQASNLPANKKSAIIKKQTSVISTLQRISDTIKVNQVTNQAKATDAMKKENSSWSISNIEKQAASVDQNNVQLL